MCTYKTNNYKNNVTTYFTRVVPGFFTNPTFLSLVKRFFFSILLCAYSLRLRSLCRRRGRVKRPRTRKKDLCRTEDDARHRKRRQRTSLKSVFGHSLAVPERRAKRCACFTYSPFETCVRARVQRDGGEVRDSGEKKYIQKNTLTTIINFL